jgi:hypothetical protein
MALVGCGAQSETGAQVPTSIAPASVEPVRTIQIAPPPPDGTPPSEVPQHNEQPPPITVTPATEARALQLLRSEPALKPVLENGFGILHMDNWGASPDDVWGVRAELRIPPLHAALWLPQ